MIKNFQNYIIDEMPKELQHINKCIISKIPSASTFLFSRTLRKRNLLLRLLRNQNKYDEKLEYEKVVRQDDENKRGSSHVRVYAGDSGSPFWKYDGSNRAIVVSIVSSKVGPKYGPIVTLMDNPHMQCNQKATKLTEEVVLWIKDKAGIPIKNPGKEQKRSNPVEPPGTKMK